MKKFIKRILYKYEQKKRDALQKLAITIGYFYVVKQNSASQVAFEEARKNIDALGITKLNIKGNVFTITLTRPGLLIGHKGKNIDQLHAYLSKEYRKKVVIHIKEERALQYLYPYHPNDYDCGDEF